MIHTLKKLVLSALLGSSSLAIAAPDAAPAPSAHPATSAYLFVHFTGESEDGEQIYFSLSKDGMNWQDLNQSKPVLTSPHGEKGVRDPALVRGEDGRFYLLATDLRIAAGRGWDAARYHGSNSLIIWDSSDLVNWSEPRTVNVAGNIPNAGCAWAPEAIYDPTSGNYVVYWATISPKDGVTTARIYYSLTKDFKTFTPSALYIERLTPDGTGIIDTQIVKVTDSKYKYYRASRDSQITIEGADSILGEWTRIGDLASLGYTAKKVEGPILYQFNDARKWGLLVDQYAAGKGYLPFVTDDLSDITKFKVLDKKDYSFGASKKRHGEILSITTAEYDALMAKWGK